MANSLLRRIFAWCLVLLSVALLGAAAQQPNKTEPPLSARNPHGAISIPCVNCHTFTSWKPIRQAPDFDHSRTGYPLVGQHRDLACTNCHTNLVFSKASTRCADCHADIHRGQFGTSCDRCHAVQGWTASQATTTSSHQNRFPLVLAHAVAACDACHKGAASGQFQGLSTQCYSCHTRDFQTASPNHVMGGFPTRCEQCHTMSSWLGARFDHRQTALACSSCHMSDYRAATAPNHLTSKFPTTCDQCHNVNSWMGATFDHSQTGFGLMGAHASVTCVACHVNNNYNLTSADAACSTCHLADYRGTTTPNHAAAAFPTDCSVCHSTVNWAGAVFNHAATGWPLTGAHASATCSACHVNNNYNLNSASTGCINCHQSDFAGASTPVNHAGFPTTCNNCHDAVSWMNATFNHSATGFPLTGAHTAVPCANCHVNNNYGMTSGDTACSKCHMADYNNASPNHQTAGFPLTCATCHTTTNWAGATFNHTWFPSSHGGANGVCATCHTNRNDFSVFQCTGCHSASSVSARHSGVSGFVYDSAACYRCHPSGG